MKELLEKVLSGEMSAVEAVEVAKECGPSCVGSVEDEKCKEKKYAEAPAKIEAMKKTRARADAIIAALYDETVKANPTVKDELKLLALTKKLMDGVNLWDSFSRFCEAKGLIEPSRLGIYESKKGEKNEEVEMNEEEDDALHEGTEVKIANIPKCDICKKADAEYDTKTKMGPWAYLCKGCYPKHSVGKLGTGLGQKLIKAEK